MIELFRYIEQSFVVPPANVNAIDVTDSSDFQNKLRSDLQQEENVPLQLRKDASDFIDANSNEAENPLNLRQQYLDFHDQLLGLTSVSADDIEGTIFEIFDSSTTDLVSSDAFKNDKQFLNDLILAVKMVTGFDKVRVNDLVAMRQAIAFIEEPTGRNCQMASVEDIRAKLLRPIVVPSAFLKTQPPQPPSEPLPTGDSDEVKKRKALQKEYDSLKAAYSTLMSLRPDELQMTEVPGIQKPAIAAANIEALTSQSIKSITEAPKQVLALTDAAIRKLDPSVMIMFESELLDIKTTGHAELVKTINYKARDLSFLINPCDRVKAVTKVIRVGVNVFAVKSDSATISTAPASTPDFSHAITRPVGIGNLQVVRQELLGYEAKEISHIENILEGEILRHSTIRSDTSEVTITDETQTTQTDERDLQSYLL